MKHISDINPQWEKELLADSKWQKFKAEKITPAVMKVVEPVEPTPEELAQWKQQEEEARKKYAEEEATRLDQQIREKATRLMGTDSIYANIRLNDPSIRSTAVVVELRKELGNLSRAYLVLGGTGSGKTFGCVAFSAEIMGRRGAKYIHALKLSNLIERRKWDDLDALEATPLLIVDELGAEPDGFKGSDFLTHFNYIFDTRYRNGLTTIIISNMSAKAVAEKYGERFVSRFREIGRLVQTEDPDYRVKCSL